MENNIHPLYELRIYNTSIYPVPKYNDHHRQQHDYNPLTPNAEQPLSIRTFSAPHPPVRPSSFAQRYNVAISLFVSKKSSIKIVKWNKIIRNVLYSPPSGPI